LGESSSAAEARKRCAGGNLLRRKFPKLLETDSIKKQKTEK
jgi:hypothetical protein